ncbi:MAG: hypothetical protein WAV84_06140, partial [Bacteroidota bacterium]
PERVESIEIERDGDAAYVGDRNGAHQRALFALKVEDSTWRARPIAAQDVRTSGREGVRT